MSTILLVKNTFLNTVLAFAKNVEHIVVNVSSTSRTDGVSVYLIRTILFTNLHSPLEKKTWSLFTNHAKGMFTNEHEEAMISNRFLYW